MDDNNDNQNTPNNQNFQPLPRPTDTAGVLKDILGGLIMGATGRTTPVSARALGIPQAAGLTPQELQQLMMMPDRQAKAQELQERVQTAPMRRQLLAAQTKLDLAKAKFAAIDPHDLTPRAIEDHLKELDSQLGGMKGMIQNGVDPDYFKELKDERDRFEKAFEETTRVPKSKNVKTAQPDFGAKTKIQYAKTAVGPGGRKMGYNLQTKKWELIQ